VLAARIRVAPERERSQDGPVDGPRPRACRRRDDESEESHDREPPHPISLLVVDFENIDTVERWSDVVKSAYREAR
jgi:hypothetical protein